MRINLIIAAILFAGCKALGGGGEDPGSLTGPSGSSGGLPGVWTGTLARANGQSLTVRWELGPEVNNGNTGPMTLTSGGTSVTVPGRASVSGNSSSGFTLHVSLDGNQGTIAGFPSCSIRASPNGAPPAFTSPFRNISISLQTTIVSCQGFIDPPGPMVSTLQEVAQLTLTKS